MKQVGPAQARERVRCAGAGAQILLLAVVSGAPACNEPCCTSFDGRTISVLTSPAGAFFVRIGTEKAGPLGLALLDTATPINLWQAAGAANNPGVEERSFAFFDGQRNGVMRARFAGIPTLPAHITPGDPAAPVIAILGGEFLQRFSFTLSGAVPSNNYPSIALWHNLPASSDFLSAAGYAVLGVDTLGGGQIAARGKPDIFGQRSPYQFPATRLLLRVCAQPAAFDPDGPLPVRCCPGDERTLATGADMTLILGTGYGPLILAESSWRRLVARAGLDANSEQGPVAIEHPSLRQPVAARAARIARLALVDREARTSDDPGPCVELGRARRLEQIARRQARDSARAACAEPCDQDRRALPRALDSASYVALGGGIDVAVVPDDTPFLQAIRAEIRPDGPELDGILGAGALKSLRVEIDYRPQPSRLVASCLPSTTPEQCRAVGRCPRLWGRTDSRVCFGLGEHRLPEVCDNYPVSCP